MTAAKIQDSITNSKSQTKNSKGICGLINIGNTNYINSLVQALTALPSIRIFFKSFHQRNESSTILFGSKSTKKYINSSIYMTQ